MESEQNIVIEADSVWSAFAELLMEMGRASVPGWVFIALLMLVLIFGGLIFLIYRMKYRNGGDD